jgi:hypothetical protein
MLLADTWRANLAPHKRCPHCHAEDLGNASAVCRHCNKRIKESAECDDLQQQQQRHPGAIPEEPLVNLAPVMTGWTALTKKASAMIRLGVAS